MNFDDLIGIPVQPILMGFSESDPDFNRVRRGSTRIPNNPSMFIMARLRSVA